MEDKQEQADEQMAAPTKVLAELAELVEAVLKSLPASKPWQRQLLQHLREVDRTTQVLRLTMTMKRAPEELTAAKEQLRIALRVANNYVSMGRADLATKAAVRLAFEIGQRATVV